MAARGEATLVSQKQEYVEAVLDRADRDWPDNGTAMECGEDSTHGWILAWQSRKEAA